MIPTLLSIVRITGKEILSQYTEIESSFQTKADGSPVTKADELSHRSICQALHEISPYPILSEENPVDHFERKDWDLFWLVDPLDGTKDFLARNGEFCINIALIYKRHPILGVIFAPALDELYYATKGGKAFLETYGQCFQLPRKITPNQVVGVSRFHDSNPLSEFISLNQFKNVQKLGSALKFGRLAQGQINFYPRFIGSSEWDIAAGDIILQESGGQIIDLKTKKTPLYNSQTLRNNQFIACAQPSNFSTLKLPLPTLYL